MASAEKSASLENDWVFGPDVPTTDFFQHRDVRDDSDLEWLVNDLIYALERGEFLQWEAVVCQELHPGMAHQNGVFGYIAASSSRGVMLLYDQGFSFFPRP